MSAGIGLVVLLAASPAAHAGKVPVTVNIGLGPMVSWLGNPANGPMARSYGASIMAEAWVDKKTLHSKKVMRRVPSQFRGMVKNMDDAHITPLPLMLVPDLVGIGPLPPKDATGTSVVPVSWSPISISLIHATKGPHVVLDVQPRVSWLRMADADERASSVWLGAALQPEVQTSLEGRVGFAVGGHGGAGWVPALKKDLDGYAMPWLHLDGYARLQVRVPIEISM
ncbi:MAG: hypothetical protein ACI8PZ_007265 [Myxococcota bacterium]